MLGQTNGRLMECVMYSTKKEELKETGTYQSYWDEDIVVQFSCSVAKPYTSKTRISKSPLGHRGGLLKVWQRSVFPKRMFSSSQIAWPSLTENMQLVIIDYYCIPIFATDWYFKIKVCPETARIIWHHQFLLAETKIKKSKQRAL